MQSTCEYFTEDRSFYCGRMPFLKFTTKSSKSSFVHFNKTVLACTPTCVCAFKLFNVQNNIFLVNS